MRPPGRRRRVPAFDRSGLPRGRRPRPVRIDLGDHDAHGDTTGRQVRGSVRHVLDGGSETPDQTLQLVDVIGDPTGLGRREFALGDLHRQADSEQPLDRIVLPVAVHDACPGGLRRDLLTQPAQLKAVQLKAVQGGRR